MNEDRPILLVNALAVLAIIFIVIGLIFTIAHFTTALKRIETQECKKWQEYAVKYEGFYLVKWQKAQCDYREVEINAPVQ